MWKLKMLMCEHIVLNKLYSLLVIILATCITVTSYWCGKVCWRVKISYVISVKFCFALQTLKVSSNSLFSGSPLCGFVSVKLHFDVLFVNIHCLWNFTLSLWIFLGKRWWRVVLRTIISSGEMFTGWKKWGRYSLELGWIHRYLFLL